MKRCRPNKVRSGETRHTDFTSTVTISQCDGTATSQCYTGNVITYRDNSLKCDSTFKMLNDLTKCPNCHWTMANKGELAIRFMTCSRLREVNP